MRLKKTAQNYVLVALLLVFALPKVYQDAHRLLAHHHFGQAKNILEEIHFSNNASCGVASYLFYLATLADQTSVAIQISFPELGVQKLQAIFLLAWPLHSFLRRGPPLQNN